MRVLDMFSGLGGWKAAFEDRGHEVITTDIDPRFGCTVTGDILHRSTVEDLAARGPYDLVVASPPCEAFSVASMNHHWTGGFRQYVPATVWARQSLRIVAVTLEVVKWAPAWVMENPVGMLRKMPVVAGIPRSTVTYCQYGERFMKPTDLWLGGSAVSLMFRPRCSPNAPCHEAAPRGARTGIQGLRGAAERAVIPYLLASEICQQIEDLEVAHASA